MKKKQKMGFRVEPKKVLKGTEGFHRVVTLGLRNDGHVVVASSDDYATTKLMLREGLRRIDDPR